MKSRSAFKSFAGLGCAVTIGLGLSTVANAQQIAAAPGGTGLTSNTVADAATLRTAAQNGGRFGAGLLGGNWDTTGGLGLSLNQGNSDTLLFNGELSTGNTWGANEFGFDAAFIYGETDGATTNQFGIGELRYNRIIAEPFYLGAVGGFLHDDTAELDYRISATPTLGVYLIKNDTTSLSLEAGVGYIWEKQSGIDDEYVSFRAGQVFSHELSARSSFFESVEFLSEFEDFGNSSIIAEAGLITQLTEKLSLKTLVRGVFDNQLPDGLDVDDTDWSLVSTLSYAFAGADELTSLEDLEAAQAAKGTSSDWQTTALAGLALTGGNSDTTLATLNLVSVREWGPNLLGLSAGGTYGEVSDEVTAESYAAGANYRRTIAAPFYFGVGASYLHDDLAQVDYRATANPTLGVYLIKNDITTLNVEAGPSYVWEEVGGEKDEYLGVRVAQGLEHQCTEGVKIWELLEYLGDVDDSDNYIINGEVGFETAISDKLSLKTYVQAIYDNTPAAGLDDTDIRLVSALAITF